MPKIYKSVCWGFCRATLRKLGLCLMPCPSVCTSVCLSVCPSVCLSVYLSVCLCQGDVSALCLLDLTAAFDTVDHDLLMLRLERQFGLRGVVLQWFSSYLSDRTFQVVLAVARRLWLSSLVLCLKVLFWGRICLSYARRTLQM